MALFCSGDDEFEPRVQGVSSQSRAHQRRNPISNVSLGSLTLYRDQRTLFHKSNAKIQLEFYCLSITAARARGNIRSEPLSGFHLAFRKISSSLFWEYLHHRKDHSSCPALELIIARCDRFGAFYKRQLCSLTECNLVSCHAISEDSAESSEHRSSAICNLQMQARMPSWSTWGYRLGMTQLPWWLSPSTRRHSILWASSQSAPLS